MRPRRSRLTNRQREDLWDSECAKARERGERWPRCNICSCFIMVPGDRWHISHDPYLPRALGGAIAGVAHDLCNRRWNQQHDTPLVAKSKRIRQKFIGAYRSRSPMQGGRDDPRKRTFDGRVVDRATGLPWVIRMATVRSGGL